MNPFRATSRCTRWSCLRLVAAALATLLLPALAAFGAEGGARHGSPWLDFAYKVVNFTVLAGLIFYFARRPLGRFLAGSAAEVSDTFFGTRKRAEQAAAELEQQKQKIAGLEAELQQMVAAARADAANEHAQMVTDAEAHGERIKTQGRQQVEQEIRKAKATLKAELAERTVELAAELIRARLDDEQRSRLVAEFVDQLEGRT